MFFVGGGHINHNIGGGVGGGGGFLEGLYTDKGSVGIATRVSCIVMLAYLNLPKPTLLQVLIIHPNMEFIGTLQKSRFW